MLLVAVLVAGRTAYRASLRTEEYAFACDPFGYLRMAKEIRKSVHTVTLPDFRLESGQTRTLIDFMKTQNVPVPQWEEIVAPHAHHYFPVSGYVGAQYPPGTGLTLAIFPEGSAVYRLNQITIIVFLLTGILAIAFAAWRKSWMSAGLVALAVYLPFAILTRVTTQSFSINAGFVPLLLACLFVLAASHLQRTRHRLAWAAALFAGLLLGYATQIRLPTLLLAPGFLILLWPRSWRIGLKSLPVIFLFAVALAGILPVLANQQRIAGRWYLPTYASVDAALPNVARVKENIPYFFGWSGPAAQDNWALAAAVIGFLGFALLRFKDSDEAGRLRIKRLAVSAFVIWSLSAVFFVTHWITASHYMIPAIFASVTLLAFGALITEASRPLLRRINSRGAIAWAGLLLVILPGVIVSFRAITTRSQGPAPSQPVAHAPVILPDELSGDQNWIWADLMTGTLWYYDQKPAFKIQFTNPETRALLFKFVFDRGEQQYLLRDSQEMEKSMGEIGQLGGTLEQRGTIEGQPYFLIRWPKNGPAISNRVAVN